MYDAFEPPKPKPVPAPRLPDPGTLTADVLQVIAVPDQLAATATLTLSATLSGGKATEPLVTAADRSRATVEDLAATRPALADVQTAIDRCFALRAAALKPVTDALAAAAPAIFQAEQELVGLIELYRVTAMKGT